MVRLRMISLGPIAGRYWKTASIDGNDAKDDDALAQRFLDALQADRLRRAEFLRPQ